MRALVTGWFGFLHGEATAGDVGAAAIVSSALNEAGIPHDIGRSPNTLLDGPFLEHVSPDAYDHVVFMRRPAVPSGPLEAVNGS